MEAVIGRYLILSEVVHHINGDRHDNKITNLELFSSHSEHIKSRHTESYIKNLAIGRV
jgi:hypothetical protein